MQPCWIVGGGCGGGVLRCEMRRVVHSNPPRLWTCGSEPSRRSLPPFPTTTHTPPFLLIHSGPCPLLPWVGCLGLSLPNLPSPLSMDKEDEPIHPWVGLGSSLPHPIPPPALGFLFFPPHVSRSRAAEGGGGSWEWIPFLHPSVGSKKDTTLEERNKERKTWEEEKPKA